VTVQLAFRVKGIAALYLLVKAESNKQ
jgi:hypothetical protein